MAIVYQHRRKDTNEIFYIGIGKRKGREQSFGGRNKYWHNVVNKVGFTAEIIIDDMSWKDIQYVERYLIAYYGRKDLGLGPLVNMTDGGSGSNGNAGKHAWNKGKTGLQSHTPESKAKIGKAISLAKTGRSQPNNSGSKNGRAKNVEIEFNNRIVEFETMNEAYSYMLERGYDRKYSTFWGTCNKQGNWNDYKLRFKNK